jgi:hypothetical protein
MQDFISLAQKDKVDLLYQHGVYVGKRRLGKKVVVLYQLEDFYAEVFYRTYRMEIDRISCFASTGRLDPYLSDIDVEHLVL